MAFLSRKLLGFVEMGWIGVFSGRLQLGVVAPPLCSYLIACTVALLRRVGGGPGPLAARAVLVAALAVGAPAAVPVVFHAILCPTLWGPCLGCTRSWPSLSFYAVCV